MLQAYPNLSWDPILVHSVTWGALLTRLSILARFSPVCWPASLARLLDSQPHLAWAGPIPQLWTFGTVSVGYFVFLAEDFNRIAPPHVGHSSCKALGIRIYWPGLSNIGKISPFVFACLISRLLDSHPHIYFGLIGITPRCRLLGLVGKKIPPCHCLPYFKAFGFSLSYLPWAHGAIPQL
jgi:hypothetical protein